MTDADDGDETVVPNLSLPASAAKDFPFCDDFGKYTEGCCPIWPWRLFPGSEAILMFPVAFGLDVGDATTMFKVGGAIARSALREIDPADTLAMHGVNDVVAFGEMRLR